MKTMTCALLVATLTLSSTAMAQFSDSIIYSSPDNLVIKDGETFPTSGSKINFFAPFGHVIVHEGGTLSLPSNSQFNAQSTTIFGSLKMNGNSTATLGNVIIGGNGKIEGYGPSNNLYYQTFINGGRQSNILSAPNNGGNNSIRIQKRQ